MNIDTAKIRRESIRWYLVLAPITPGPMKSPKM
jgi:hypothetical protein